MYFKWKKKKDTNEILRRNTIIKKTYFIMQLSNSLK